MQDIKSESVCYNNTSSLNRFHKFNKILNCIIPFEHGKQENFDFNSYKYAFKFDISADKGSKLTIGCDSRIEFMEWWNNSIEPDKRFFYELIRIEDKIAEFYDIDRTIDHKDYVNVDELSHDLIDSFLQVRNDYYPIINKKDIIVLSAHTNEKLSLHIISKKTYFENYKSHKTFAKKIKEDFKIDTTVYSDNRSFRMYKNHKFGKKNDLQLFYPERYSHASFEDTLVVLTHSDVSNRILIEQEYEMKISNQIPTHDKLEDVHIKALYEFIDKYPYLKLGDGNRIDRIDNVTRPCLTDPNDNHSIENMYWYINDEGNLMINCFCEKGTHLCILKRYIKPEENNYFRFDDPYTFTEFRQTLNSGDAWDSYNSFSKYIYNNINRCLIQLENEEVYIKIDYQTLSFVKRIPEFSIGYMGLDKKGKSKELNIRFSTFYNQMKGLKIYKRLIFEPCVIDETFHLKNRDGYEFNCWFGFKSARVNTIDMVKIEPVINHIFEVWCDSQQVLFDYVISWFQTIFNCKRTKTALIFQSGMGAGKSIITDWLYKYVFGDLFVGHQGLSFASKNFNSSLKNKLLLCCEELTTVNGNNYHSMFEALKDLITNDKLIINQKYIAEVTSNNYINLIAFTNSDFSLKLEHSDRRYFVNRCNDKYIGDKKYFDNLIKNLTQESANQFFTWVLDYKNTIDLRLIPMTNIKQDIITYNEHSSIRFIKIFIEHRDERLIINNKIRTNVLFDLFKQWCEDTNETKISQKLFSSKIKNILPILHKSDGNWFQLPL